MSRGTTFKSCELHRLSRLVAMSRGTASKSCELHRLSRLVVMSRGTASKSCELHRLSRLVVMSLTVDARVLDPAVFETNDSYQKVNKTHTPKYANRRTTIMPKDTEHRI